jgi:ATP-dependent DNA helicase RecG
MRMIDQVGSGIRRMFEMQRGRFLPLPDYSFDASESGLPRVEVTISGQVLDAKYTQTLMRRSDLELRQVVLLDRVQKGAALTKAEASQLRRLGLIEGRFPRVFVSARVAAATGGQAQHIRKRGFDNRYYRDLLVELIREHGPIGPSVITELFLDKLPDSLREDQKRAKIRNLTFDLAHRRGVIENVGQPRGPGALWRLREADQAKPAARPIIQDQK